MASAELAVSKELLRLETLGIVCCGELLSSLFIEKI